MIATLLVWVLMVYGISNVGVYGSILNGFRNKIESWGNNPYFPFSGFFHFLREMMRCMMCLPMWVGFFVGFFVYSPISNILAVNHWYSWFFDGCLASGSTWLIHTIQEWYEQNRPVTDHRVTLKQEEINNDKIL